ncbi:hypothetical protein TURU_054745 [Turdus rufiventris]|nr:hypothetical protein TURU_054745 [Turdus rufiventris]
MPTLGFSSVLARLSQQNPWTLQPRFLTLDDLPSLEEIEDILAKQQLEFREIPKPAKNGAGKASPGQEPARAALVAEASMVIAAGGIKQAPPEPPHGATD